MDQIWPKLVVCIFGIHQTIYAALVLQITEKILPRILKTFYQKYTISKYTIFLPAIQTSFGAPLQMVSLTSYSQQRNIKYEYFVYHSKWKVHIEGVLSFQTRVCE